MRRVRRLERAEPEPEPHREGIDWIRTEDGDLCHPLEIAALNRNQVLEAVDELGLDKMGDKDLEQFIFEFQTTSAKLAGALVALPGERVLPMPRSRSPV